MELPHRQRFDQLSFIIHHQPSSFCQDLRSKTSKTKTSKAKTSKTKTSKAKTSKTKTSKTKTPKYFLRKALFSSFS